MTWLAIGAGALLLAVLLARGFATASVATIKKAAAWTGASLGLVLLVLLVISGRAVQVIWMAALLIPLLTQVWQSWRTTRTFARGGQATPGQESRVETRTLEMVLHHDSGRMTGTVRRGRYAGADLADLDLAALRGLLADCMQEDPESVPLLEAWLDRSHPDWRTTIPEAEGPMTRADALAILGLENDATETEIRAAHRRLMRTAHPDRGGSAWLAARLNAARDFLLGA